MSNKRILIISFILLSTVLVPSQKLVDEKVSPAITEKPVTQPPLVSVNNAPRPPLQKNDTSLPIAIAIRSDEQNEDDELWKGLKGNAVRSRIIDLGDEILSNEVLDPGQLVALRLFDDVDLEGEVKNSFRNVNGTISTLAHIRGSEFGRIFIAETNGQVRAKITYPEKNKIFAIHYNPGNKQHYALELDISSEQIDDAEPHPQAPDISRADTISETLSDPAALEDVPLALGDESVAATVVDVMVVYSDTAWATAGSQENMNNVIAIGMLMANDAHINTDTGIIVNLVHSTKVSYTDSGSNSTDLSRLRLTSDSYMDNVHTLRDSYGADFVSLINDGGGGLGYVLNSLSGTPSYAFTVVGYSAFDSYTAVHEIGHNMGLSHAYDQDYQWGPTGGDIGDDAAGWHWHPVPLTTGYCSVMTYTSGSYFDGIPADNPNAATDGLGHIRVGLFSDPNIIDNGLAAGHVTYGNNARVLRLLKSVYQGYRTRPISATTILVEYPNGSEQLKEGENVHISWNSNGITGNVKIDLYESNVFKQTIDADTFNDRVYVWTIPAGLSGSTFKIRVSSVTDGAVYDESDNIFAITENIYTETLDSSPGYSITGGTGAWEYGAWTTDTDLYGGPSSPFTGTNLYDTNLTGGSFITTTLTTGAIDCSNYQQVRLGFAGWFSINTGYRAKVQVSNDNTVWHDLYSQDGYYYSSAWTVYDLDISSYADGESTVYIRWVHEDLGGGSNYAGMSVDDIKISGILVPAVDILAPVFTWVPSDMTVSTPNPDISTAKANWSTPTAIDNVDGTIIPVQTVGLPSGSLFPLGTHTITYQATDSSANSSTASFTVTVIVGQPFPWTMFLPAILYNSLP